MRRYRIWGGNPQGTPEDPTKCVATVQDGGRSCLSGQCNKPRGKGELGDLCGTHARVEAAGGRGRLWIPEDENPPRKSSKAVRVKKEVAEIGEKFKRLEELEKSLAHVRAIKAQIPKTTKKRGSRGD